MRPGPILGAYPEREHAPGMHGPTLLERAEKLRDRNAFVAAVCEYEGRFRAHDAETLVQIAKQLRIELRARGFLEELVIRAFVLIREHAFRELGMAHLPSQIEGGRAMLDGALVEMPTGEGKTLMACLPACTAALAGVPVHVISVNAYLVARDAGALAGLYRALGLSLGVVTAETDDCARKQAYAADVTYCENTQLVFDYLKDRVALGIAPIRPSSGLWRVSGTQTAQGNMRLRGLCFAIVDEADSVLVDEARTPLVLATADSTTALPMALYAHVLTIAEQLTAPRDYILEQGTVRLNDTGRARVHELGERWSGAYVKGAYGEDLLRQALTALTLLRRDRDYLVVEERIQLIDEHTGRVLADRRWTSHLQHLLEVKEHCPISTDQATLAQLSYQRFFRRYLHLCGTSATLTQTNAELREVYAKPVVPIAPHKPSLLQVYPLRLVRAHEDKLRLLVHLVKEMRGRQRPVLVGTLSVAQSENVALHLAKEGIPANVLNARQDADEAALVAGAGNKGVVTVATNMAGRGTDIPLGAGVAALGGLHVIAFEANEETRIDAQLRGRAARQGNPGSFEPLAALSDRCLRERGILSAVAGVLLDRAPWLAGKLAHLAIRQTQRTTEQRRRALRRTMLQADAKLSDTFAFTGSVE